MDYISKKTQKKNRRTFVAPSLESDKVLSKDHITTWARSSTVLETYIGKTFKVYNGKTFKQVLIRPEMVGLKLGEFSRTRKRGKDPRPKKTARQKKA